MQHLIRRTALSLAITTIATFAVATPTQAAEQTQNALHTFNIAPGSLDQALTRFADQAGLRLMVASEVLKGQESKGLSGQFSTREGVQRLLDGSGLKASFNGDMLLIEKVQVGDKALGWGRPSFRAKALD
ncbi:hypothetical protein DBADOPDK_03633 [Pseudomonas sp. MM223]|nr:hypothetical protein DBADOPDK_03633 [Pseudomonas sp. MM223]